MHIDSDHETSASDGSWSILDALQPTPSVPQVIDVVIYKDKQEHLLARMNPAKCRESLHQWTLLLNSEFGEHPIEVQFGTAPNEQGAVATINNTQILINESSTILPETLSDLCEKSKSGIDQVIVEDSSVEQQVLVWLSRVAPDCSLTIENGGTWCQLNKIGARDSEEELHNIRLTMIRRWSRQPYILIRRLSVSINLAKALQSPNINQSLDTFCRVIEFSDPVELPLALSTEAFRNSVCAKASGHRMDAAKVGLSKSMDEIELLRQLFERTSKLGVLAVRVPSGKAPTRDLLVSLTPDETVADSLIAEAARLSTGDGSATLVPDQSSLPEEFVKAKGCWHPLFSDSTNTKLIIANHLFLAGSSANISCDSITSSPGQTSHQYLADSITSESEFVITNGASKLLRLPNGSYNYKITGHSQSMGWEPVPEDETTGKISWEGRRPSANIQNW